MVACLRLVAWFGAPCLGSGQSLVGSTMKFLFGRPGLTTNDWLEPGTYKENGYLKCRIYKEICVWKVGADKEKDYLQSGIYKESGCLERRIYKEIRVWKVRGDKEK